LTTTLHASAEGTIGAPEECHDTSFTTSYPCDRSFNTTYDDVFYWWDDYTRCNIDNLAPDSNLLITKCDGIKGGGLAGDTKAHANGNLIQNLPASHTTYDNSGGAWSMGVAMQEVGHNLQSGVSDSDNDEESEHDTAITYSHDDQIYGTPMGVTYWEDTEGDNECGDSYSDPPDSDHVHFNYSSCAGKNMN